MRTASHIQHVMCNVMGGAYNYQVLEVDHMYRSRALPVMSSEDHMTTDIINQVNIEQI